MKYTLKIITERGRGDDGVLTIDTFEAKNDAHAVLQVFHRYDLCNGYRLEEIEEDGTDQFEAIQNAVEHNIDVEKITEMLCEMYLDDIDISDYYDTVVSLTDENNKMILDGQINVEEWFSEYNLNKNSIIRYVHTDCNI